MEPRLTTVGNKVAQTREYSWEFVCRGSKIYYAFFHYDASMNHSNRWGTHHQRLNQRICENLIIIYYVYRTRSTKYKK